MKCDLKRSETFRKKLIDKTKFVDENLLDNAKFEPHNDKDDDDRVIGFESVSKNPSTIEKRTYNPPSSNVAVSFIANDEIGKGRSKFYSLQGGKGLQAICDINPEYDLLQYRTSFVKQKTFYMSVVVSGGREV